MRISSPARVRSGATPALRDWKLVKHSASKPARCAQPPKSPPPPLFTPVNRQLSDATARLPSGLQTGGQQSQTLDPSFKGAQRPPSPGIADPWLIRGHCRGSCRLAG